MSSHYGEENSHGHEAHVNAFDRAQQAMQIAGTQNNFFGADSGAGQTLVSLAVPIGRRSDLYPLRGRDHILRSLEERWTATGSSRIHVLWGLGGAGKSQLALEFAYKMREAGVDVWWMSASDSLQLTAGMQSLALRVGVASADATRSDIADLIWERLYRLSKPWLLVLDSVDDANVLTLAERKLSDGAAWIRPLTSSFGTIIVTSRDGRPEAWANWIERHQVGPLEDDAAAQMLIDYAGAEAGTKEQSATLAQAVGNLPLAIRLIGAYLARVRSVPAIFSDHAGSETPRSFDDYRMAFLRDQGNALELTSKGISSPYTAEHYIQWPWEKSLGYIERSGNSHARSLLKLLSQLDDAPIPYGILLSPARVSKSNLFSRATGIDIWNSINELANFALLDIEHVESGEDQHVQTLLLHPLVRAAGARQIDRDERPIYLNLAAMLLASACRSDLKDYGDTTGWVAWQSILPHISHLLNILAGTKMGAPETLAALSTATAAMSCAHVLSEQGRYDQAEDIYRAVLSVRKGILGEDHESTLATRRNIAQAMARQHKTDEAIAMLHDVLELQIRALGGAHKDTLFSLHIMAHLLEQQSKPIKAEEILGSIATLQEESLGPTHSDTLRTRHALGRAIIRQGRAAEGEALLRSVLDCRAAILGRDHTDTITTKYILADAIRRQDRLLESESLQREILEARIRILGAGHADTLKSMHTLAQTIASQGRESEAEAVLQDLLDLRIKLLGPDHPSSIRLKHSIALDAAKKRGSREAASMLRQIYEFESRQISANGPRLLSIRHSLAHEIEKHGTISERRKEFEELFSVERQMLGDEHESTLCSQHALAHVMYDEGRTAEAETELRSVLLIQIESLGVNHRDTLRTKRCLAIFEARGKPSE